MNTMRKDRTFIPKSFRNRGSKYNPIYFMYIKQIPHASLFFYSPNSLSWMEFNSYLVKHYQRADILHLNILLHNEYDIEIGLELNIVSEFFDAVSFLYPIHCADGY